MSKPFKDRHKSLRITHGPADGLPRPWLTPTTFCTIEVKCYSIQGQKPHFSVTVNGRDFGGCCHDLVHELRPDLDPVVALHLSDCDGIPMHAAANAVYWLSGAMPDLPGFRWRPGVDHDKRETPEYCLQILKDHLRMPPLAIVEAVKKGTQDLLMLHSKRMVSIDDIRRSVETIINDIVEEQLPRWKQEADAAIQLIDSLEETDT